MNLQQLEYIIAVDKYRHFVTASENSFVTQATLSMMIKKLEDELDVKIFDRSKQPVVPTEIGAKIIEQAKLVVFESKKIKEIISEEKGILSGELKIGIIPTLAPQLLPLFVGNFLKKHPLVKLKIQEMTTDQIIINLKSNNIDAGLLATPVNQKDLTETPLFYEEFVIYSSSKEKDFLKKKYILAKDIDPDKLWLLEEGHCLRSQVINLCELKKQEKELHQLDFESGSLETLKRMVDTNGGLTILPELAVSNLSAKDLKNIRQFKDPVPAREISLVTYRHFLKQGLTKALKKEIENAVPENMRTARKKNVIDID